jgi:Ca-activated chloride channel family protein
MRFAQPSFLVVAAVACLVVMGLMALAGRSRDRALLQLGAPHLIGGLIASLSPLRRRLKQAMIVAGVTLLLVSLARPQLGYRWEEVHRRGVDLLFAVDTSKSMLTRDVKPNRLERAKLAVRDLVQRFPDDRVGLVAFAGSAFLQTPLTLDHGIFVQSLDALDTSVIPLGGTDVASAIEAASKALSDDRHKKVLVLLTDGEDLQGDALVAAEQASKAGLVIDTIGVGTPSGELVPIAAGDGPTQFVRDEQGNLVTSRLDEPLLRRIAQATGGTYRPLGDTGAGLASLYTESLSKLPQSDLAGRTQKVPIERYQWPLGLALVLLGVEPLVGERRRRNAASRHARAGKSSRGPRLAAGVGLGALLLVSASASASPQSAERAYRAGKFDQAEADYANAQKAAPRDARLSFDLGDAAYRKGDFDGAAKAFETTLRGDDLKLQEKAYYNLGNVRYRMGEHALAGKDVEATRSAWKAAVSRYEGAIALDANDQEARDNLALVKRRLAELDQQQQKDQDKSAQEPKNDKNQKNDKNSKNDKNQKDGNGKPDARDDGRGQPDPANGKGPPKEGAPPKSTTAGPNGANPSQGGGPKESTPQGQGPQTSQAPPSGHGDAKNAGAPSGEPSAADAPSAPGELSKQEARALLDSLRGDLAVTPRAPLGPKAPHSDDTAPRRDW